MSPLVALCDARDSYHRRAVRDLEQLGGSTFATCEAVLVESCFHLPNKSQRLRLRALLDYLAVAPLSSSADTAFRDEVFDWLSRYAEHEPDWADGCFAVLAGRDVTARVWTYDTEFLMTWRRPDGTAIPQAVG